MVEVAKALAVEDKMAVVGHVVHLALTLQTSLTAERQPGQRVLPTCGSLQADTGVAGRPSRTGADFVARNG